MGIKAKIKELYYTWLFIFNYFFRPWKIKSELVSKITDQERRNHESQINHLKQIVKVQQMECQDLNEVMDKAGARIIELTESRERLIALLPEGIPNKAYIANIVDKLEKK